MNKLTSDIFILFHNRGNNHVSTLDGQVFHNARPGRFLTRYAVHNDPIRLYENSINSRSLWLWNNYMCLQRNFLAIMSEINLMTCN